MQWCSEHGLAHSQLLDWDEEDQAKLRAYLLEESTRCVMCGTQPWEWDPKQGGSRRAYLATTVHCSGCYIRAAASEDNGAPMGTTIQLVPYSPEIVAAQQKAHLDSVKEKAGERGV